ncbi:excinuclease ATPase subunit [Pleionea sediminis]|uniref:excinuclease ATPase subunit n=1 Tax=Pleionea sediminis TaxID=2569479 RepID=UPI0011872248|nr:excinuclease ATPase subunit [Pleionea sediminis]
MTKYILILALSIACTSTMARDTKHLLNIEEAMASSDFKERLDPEVKLYFSGQKYPEIEEAMDTFTTNKKTNAFNKSDKEACQWVFLSALIQLQERAKKEGANAVVDIESYYKKKVHASSETYECHAGAIIAGVALRGKMVRL